MKHPLQPDVVIIVPKFDELEGVLEAFNFDVIPEPHERIPFEGKSIGIYRTSVAVNNNRKIPHSQHLSVAIGLLDGQTNTLSGPLTIAVLDYLNPRQAYLVGTALGNPSRSPIGSIFIANEIIDISERRVDSSDSHKWKQSNYGAHHELLRQMQTFIRNTYRGAEDIKRFFRNLESSVSRDKYGQTREIIENASPKIDCEAIVSGNDYIMYGEARDELWTRFSHCNTFDMEATGFCLAATLKNTPWLIIRAVSDHGDPTTKADRILVTKGAALVLCEFLKSRYVKIDEICSPHASLTAIDVDLNGEKYEGFMGYIDDDNRIVTYSEEIDFERDPSGFIGKVRSTILEGNSDRRLEYDVRISITNSTFFAGTWANESHYFGAIAGSKINHSIEGSWLGTHGGGIRSGIFVWYNDKRSEFETGQLRSSFEAKLKQTVNSDDVPTGEE